ncbi:hypothetical protein CURTO8I2_70096 [Curtobacterium sp. 8I-2]|nr:hypothetical protein CURTO8I2_70096 [Curtobacterium sp. 8I-2]
MVDRRVHVRVADPVGTDGLRVLARDGHPDGQPRHPGRARPRRPVDPLRGPDPVLRRDQVAHRRQRHEAHAGDLLRADQGRADHRPPGRDPRSRGAGRRFAQPAVHPGVLEDGRRRRCRPVRHPRHHGLGGARLPDRGTPQPQEVHLRAGRPGDRGRRLDLHVGAAPHAHRCRRCARRLRWRRSVDHPCRTRHPRPDGHRRRGRRRCPSRLPRRVGRPLRARHRRRRARHRGRHRQGHRRRRRRRHARHRAGPCDRGPGWRLPLGCRGAPPRAAAWPPGRGGHYRPARERPERPDADPRRPRQPGRCPAPLDGDDRILRRQGVPASRSGRGAVPPVTVAPGHCSG